MSELQKGWTSTTLKDVLEDFQSGFASGEKDVDGGLKHLRMNNIGVEGKLNLDLLRTVPAALASQRHYLSKGDVLFCTTNSAKLVGKCGLFDLDGQFAFSNHLTKLRANKAIIEKFLLHYLWLLWKQGEFEHKCKHWVNQSTLPKDELLDTEIVLPPLNEQRRIVVKLEKLLSRVDAAQARLANIPRILKRFRQSVLAAACSGKLTADWRAQNQVTEEYKSVTVEDVTEYVGGFAYKSPTFLECGTNQVVRIGNVRPIALNLNASSVFIPDEIAKATKRFELVPNDIVISMTGTKYKRDYGCASIVTGSNPKLFLNQRVSRLRCGGKVLPLFMLYWLQTDIFKGFFFEGETGNVNQGNVGADGIRKAPIELPTLPEQQEIVRRVEALFKTADALETRYRTAKRHVDKLTQSILALAFRGELVTTEAELARLEGRDYEPASVLLERIRQERTQQQAPKQSTSKRTSKSKKDTGTKGMFA
jgi:type I restriction enzyme S subunit